MGSGSSRTRKVDVQTQFPRRIQSASITPRTRTPSPTSEHIRRVSTEQSSWATKSKIGKSAPTMTKARPNSSLGHYASIWEQNGKLSSTFEKLIQTGSTKVEHHQEEIKKVESTTKHISTYETAQVESTLTSQIETIHNLETSQKLDTLILNLKQVHLDFDQNLKHRVGQITTETESILEQIVEETQISQQQLLIQAKEQQTIEDEQYRILLEEFISKLDEKRAKQLAFIQEQLQQQRLLIFNQSQLKIRALTEQVNSIKNQIMIEEEEKASNQIHFIVNEINSISTESAIQQIGTQIKSQFNLTIHEIVGSNNSQNNSSTTNLKRTTYISNDNIHQTISSSTQISDQQTKSIHKSVNQK